MVTLDAITTYREDITCAPSAIGGMHNLSSLHFYTPIRRCSTVFYVNSNGTSGKRAFLAHMSVLNDHQIGSFWQLHSYAMESITIYELNAMYSCVSHKLSGIFVNGLPFTWTEWLEESSCKDVDLAIEYFLDPMSKAVHIRSPELSGRCQSGVR